MTTALRHQTEARTRTTASSRTIYGRSLRIPCLKDELASWPWEVNDHLDELRVDVEGRMVPSIISNSTELKKYLATDTALLAACWAPHASMERLQAGAAYLLWGLVWDDPVDGCEEDIAVLGDIEQYAETSINYAREMLGLDDKEPDETPQHIPEYPSILNFKVFWELSRRLRVEQDKDQRQIFYQKVVAFINEAVSAAQKIAVGRFPEPSEYMQGRIHDVGIYPAVAMNGYMSGTKLPDHIMDSASMRTIWDEIVRLSIYVNDLYSMKKESEKSDRPSNLVSVLFYSNPSYSLDDVVDRIIRMIRCSRMAMDEACKSLLMHAQGDVKLERDLTEYIHVSKSMVTAVVRWNMEVKRYKLEKDIQSDGSVIIQL